jgi:hypothetical protein
MTGPSMGSSERYRIEWRGSRVCDERGVVIGMTITVLHHANCVVATAGELLLPRPEHQPIF